MSFEKYYNEKGQVGVLVSGMAVLINLVVVTFFTVSSSDIVLVTVSLISVLAIVGVWINMLNLKLKLKVMECNHKITEINQKLNEKEE